MAGVPVAKAEAKGSAAKQKERAAEDFYRFQQKDRRRDDLLALRQNFEQDKKRVQELKAARRFKPA